MTAPAVLVVELWPPVVNCRVCGVCVGTYQGFGIPMWEGDVLPNDWPGDWGGFPACLPCYSAQQQITKPTTVSELLAQVTT